MFLNNVEALDPFSTILNYMVNMRLKLEVKPHKEAGNSKITEKNMNCLQHICILKTFCKQLSYKVHTFLDNTGKTVLIITHTSQEILKITALLRISSASTLFLLENVLFSKTSIFCSNTKSVENKTYIRSKIKKNIYFS